MQLQVAFPFSFKNDRFYLVFIQIYLYSQITHYHALSTLNRLSPTLPFQALVLILNLYLH